MLGLIRLLALAEEATGNPLTSRCSSSTLVGPSAPLAISRLVERGQVSNVWGARGGLSAHVLLM